MRFNSDVARGLQMAARHMGNRGFSIGIDDVTPKAKLAAEKSKTIEDNYDKCTDLIQQYKRVRQDVM